MPSRLKCPECNHQKFEVTVPATVRLRATSYGDVYETVADSMSVLRLPSIDAGDRFRCACCGTDAVVVAPA